MGPIIYPKALKRSWDCPDLDFMVEYIKFQMENFEWLYWLCHTSNFDEQYLYTVELGYNEFSGTMDICSL
jgi:hypothetical protein